MSKREATPLQTGLLVRELKDVEWDTLGTYLGLSQGEIKEIERDHQNTARRRIVMFEKWLSKEENPSWEKMIAALDDMSENNLGSQLRKKYVYQQQPRDESQTDSPMADDDQQVMEKAVLKIDKQDQVARELESLEKKYLRLVIDAQSTLEAANLSAIELGNFSQFYLNEEVTTVKELFHLIQPFCFLDYSLLETAITFLIDPAHKVVGDLSEYVEQLTKFKKSTTLKYFMQSIENAQKSLTTRQETVACTVTLRLVGGWLTKTMDDLDKLLKEIFQDKSSVLAHIKIIKGSIIVTYLAPQSEADSLVKLAQTKLSFMPQVGVCGLDIGQRTVISEVTHNFSFQFSLFRAVVDNNINLLTFLININISPDATNDQGQTALLLGSYYGRDKAVSILLQANANPNLQRDDGISPIFMAAQEGHSDIVSILLQANANPDFRTDDGATPLSMAAQKGHSDVVSILLQANANPDLAMDDGTTPLSMAAQKGHSDVVSILLQANANPDLQKDDGATPIFMAAQEGHSDIVSILLQANANPDVQKDDGATPIFMAAQEGHSDIVSILLQANANPNLQTDNGSTSLMIACYNCYPKIVQLLLTSGGYPNLKFSNGSTALMLACRNGCLDSTELLLMSGADPSIVGPEGLTALDMAASSGHDDIVDLIQAVQLSQSSTTSPVLTATEISTSTDNKTMAIVNKAMEDMIVAKTESYISTYYKKLKKTLPLKSDQEELQTIV